jgi:hypothetical protein
VRRALAAALLLLACAAGPAAAAAPSDSFVTRAGPRLVLGGKPFRFGGANVEWLGVAGYGPEDPAGPRLASHYEIDDALATAQEMGLRVVRSQTMGDSVGCPVCIEPALGQFNAAAFEEIDYALASARRHGIRIVATIVGDDARGGGSGCVYLRWRGIDVPNCSLVNMAPFWTDPTVLGDVEDHVRALLEHVNVYTHVAYKDDPTILGWDLLNGGGSPAPWTRQLAAFVKSIDRRHLVLSSPENAGLPDVDACVHFVYPHWSQPLSFVRAGIQACRAAGKPFIAYEYGWDPTNFPTRRDLQRFLDALLRDPAVAGDAFWALQGHAAGHGWMPIPADTPDPTAARFGESGQWWALYYTGVQTLVMTADDMAARAQQIRAHAYAMAGLRVPPHRVPPAPTVTRVLYVRVKQIGPLSAVVYWQGSAGGSRYSVQRARSASGPWTTICARCATDLDDGFADPSPQARTSWYRVIPYNLDGRPGHASNALRAASG